jgi:hypothetical protein
VALRRAALVDGKKLRDSFLSLLVAIIVLPSLYHKPFLKMRQQVLPKNFIPN